MVGCILEDDEMALKYGLYREHFYLVSQVCVLRKTKPPGRFVKIHNPFNTREKIKNTERYVQLEAKLRAFGIPATKNGEFWMSYESFLRCFRRVKVCNIQPEKNLPFSLSPEEEKLKLKTVIFGFNKSKTNGKFQKFVSKNVLTEWRCVTFRGCLPASVRKLKLTDSIYRKFTIEVKGKESKDLIVSFIQDWIRRTSADMEIHLIGLQIFVYSPHNEEWNVFRSLWYQESLQWCMRTTLEPGLYLFVYESGQDDLVNDFQYCFRVFYDARENAKKEKEIFVGVYDEMPPFEPDFLD